MCGYIYIHIIVCHPVFALHCATSPVCILPCSASIWHGILSESHCIFDMIIFGTKCRGWDVAELRGVGRG